MKRYKSLPEFLSTAYPEHQWQAWQFTVTPRQWWANANNQRLFFNWLKSELHILSPSDWYNVTVDKVSSLGGAMSQQGR